MQSLLKDVQTDEIKYSCIPEPEDDGDTPVGGVYEKGVFKAHKEQKYNQLEIDPYSCFMVSPFQAISNFTGKYIGYDLMRGVFSQLTADGKFKKGYGGSMVDGMEYAIRAYNYAFSDTLKYKKVPLTTGTIIEALKSGSPVVCFIKYSKTYFSDEQNDGDAWITKAESIGTMGHCISVIKINTMGDVLMKYQENYAGKLNFDIIGVDFEKFRALFGNTGLVIYR